jgi:hypothetical protein
MLLGDGAQEAALHQVIGPRCVVGQSPRYRAPYYV